MNKPDDGILDLLPSPRERRLRMLIVEDDDLIAQPLIELLCDNPARSALPTPQIGGSPRTAWQAEHAASLADARVRWQHAAFDLLIVDRGMIDGDGLVEFVKPLRRGGYRSRILMLTQYALDRDEVQGLAAGADDYVRKPADPELLCARIDAMARSIISEARLTIGPLEIDFAGLGSVRYGAQSFVPHGTAFRILAVLALHSPQVVTRLPLLVQAWRYSERFARELSEHRNQLIETRITELRQTLRAHGIDERIIANRRGNRAKGIESGWSLDPSYLLPEGFWA